MKTETKVVKACEVRKGDVIGGYKVRECGGDEISCWMETTNKRYVQMPGSWAITVTRHVADPCPRGRMTWDRGNIRINDELILPGTIQGQELQRRLVALFAEAEREPYRTTAEIEAGEAGR